jgi:hypothetical protein
MTLMIFRGFVFFLNKTKAKSLQFHIINLIYRMALEHFKKVIIPGFHIPPLQFPMSSSMIEQRKILKPMGALKVRPL